MAANGDLLTLTRRQVLMRQIDTAIWLLRVRNEPVVANLIANAAIDVQRSLAARAGKLTFKGNLESFIKPEGLKKWREWDRAAYNHSKHADKDPEADLNDFDPRFADLNVLAATVDFGELFGALTPFMWIYRGCELAKTPDLLLEGEVKDKHKQFAEMFGAGGTGQDFDKTCGGMLQLVESRPEVLRTWPQQFLMVE